MTQKEREKLTARIAKERGFTVRELAQLGRVVDAAECRRLRVHPAAEGFAITYPGSKMVRVRYVAPRQKGQRYGQPANMLEAYYCPLLKDWPDVFKNVSTPLVITEGEFKAATACQLGVPCIGLGGVFNFASQRLGLDWLPSLERVVWQDRKVAIVFDSDAVANPMVQLAETRLALRLMERGAEVYIVRLPYDGAGLKQGLDDYIRNHGADALAQLLKQAKSCNPHRALHALNAEIVYVEQPNSVVRISDFLVMGTRDFRNDVYADRTIPSPDGKKIVSAAQEWMRWPQRNKASGLTFEPGGALFVDDAPRGRLLNTWRGWPMEPVKGSVKPYLELHKRLFGDLPPDVQRWVQQWFAYPVQFPGTKMHSALMIVGAPGAGKTLLGEYARRVYGEAGVMVTLRELEADFNSWIANKQFVVGDEVMTKENKRNLGELMKTWITSDSVAINKKHVERYYQPNKANFYLTSNHDDALHIEDNDRRYFVHEVPAEKMTPEEGAYFGEWIEKPENVAALLHYLLHEVDCAGFAPKASPPMTEAKAEMAAAARTELDSTLLELKKNPDNLELLHSDYRASKYAAGRPTILPDEATSRELGRMLFGNACPYKPETIGRRLRRFKFEQRVVKRDGAAARLYRLRPEVTVSVTVGGNLIKKKVNKYSQHPTETVNRNLPPARRKR